MDWKVKMVDDFLFFKSLNFLLYKKTYLTLLNFLLAPQLQTNIDFKLEKKNHIEWELKMIDVQEGKFGLVVLFFLRVWEVVSSHLRIEEFIVLFSFRAIHSTTHYSPSEHVYGFNLPIRIHSTTYGFNLPIISKNIKSWDECFSFVEMTYNRAIQYRSREIHSNISVSKATLIVLLLKMFMDLIHLRSLFASYSF